MDMKRKILYDLNEISSTASEMLDKKSNKKIK
jgi:hypothetical protein